MFRMASGPSPSTAASSSSTSASFGASGSRRRLRGGSAISGTRAAPSVKRMNDRTAASRRAIVDGASPRRPRPSSAVYSASACTSTSSSVRPAAREPAGEVREVGGVGPPGRLGEARAGEEPVDRGAQRPPGRIRPLPAPAFPMRSTFFFAALLVAVALGGAARRPPPRRAGRRAPPAGTVTLVGDSLNVGVERYLAGRPAGLEDRRERPRRTVDARGDRRARGGAAALSSHVVVSLGTNDPPTACRRSAPTSRGCSSSSARTAASSGRRSGATAPRATPSTPSCVTRPRRTTGSGSSNGPRWSRRIPTGSPPTACTATRRATASAPARSPRRRRAARRRRR